MISGGIELPARGFSVNHTGLFNLLNSLESEIADLIEDDKDRYTYRGLKKNG